MKVKREYPDEQLLLLGPILALERQQQWSLPSAVIIVNAYEDSSAFCLIQLLACKKIPINI